MINIPLDDNHRITSDAKQFILQKKSYTTDKNTGDRLEQWKGMSYHTNIAGLAKELWRREVLLADIKSFEELDRAMSDSLFKISQMLKGHGFEVKVMTQS